MKRRFWITAVILASVMLMHLFSGCLGSMLLNGALSKNETETAKTSDSPTETAESSTESETLKPAETDVPTESELPTEAETKADPSYAEGDEEEIEAFRLFTDDLLRQFLEGDTLSVHSVFAEPEKAGIDTSVVALPSLSISGEGIEEYDGFIRDSLKKLDGFRYELLGKEGRLVYDSLKRFLTLEADYAGLDYLYEPLTQNNGLTVLLPIEFEEYQFYREADVRDYLDLIAQVPVLFDELLAFEEEKADRGLFMEDRILDGVIEGIDTFLDSEEDSFLLYSFETRLGELDLNEEKKQAYIEENRKTVTETVYPAFRALKEAMETFYGSNEVEGGLVNYPDGERYFEYLLKSRTGSDMTAQEMIDRIDRAFNEDMTRMYTLMMTDSSAYNIVMEQGIYPTTDLQECLDILKEKMKNDFPEIPEVHYSVRYLDKAFRESMSPAFYMIPPVDRPAKNSIVVNCDPGDEPEDIFITLAHEGYPGHLYQNNYFTERCHFNLERFLSTNGYAEGYANYVEHLSYDYVDGLTENEAEMLRLNARLSMWIYARVDLGIHAEGWTEEDVSVYLEDFFERTDELAAWMYDYMVADPGVYEQYAIGELEILDILEDAKKSAGKKFDLKEFHGALLDLSFAPFGLIRKEILGE